MANKYRLFIKRINKFGELIYFIFQTYFTQVLDQYESVDTQVRLHDIDLQVRGRYNLFLQNNVSSYPSFWGYKQAVYKYNGFDI